MNTQKAFYESKLEDNHTPKKTLFDSIPSDSEEVQNKLAKS